jgi:hypothetical protein
LIKLKDEKISKIITKITKITNKMLEQEGDEI